jgi:heme oxygenase
MEVKTMALTWLKEILGESYTDDIDKAVSAKIGAQFVSREDFNTQKQTAKSLQTQLEAAQTAAKGTEALQAQITQLTADKTKAEERVRQVQTQAAIKLALGADVHDTSLVAGLIDKEKLKISDSGDITDGLDDQIAELKKSKAFLFKTANQTEQPKPTGSRPLDGTPPARTGTREEYSEQYKNAKSIAEKVAIKTAAAQAGYQI